MNAPFRTTDSDEVVLARIANVSRLVRQASDAVAQADYEMMRLTARVPYALMSEDNLAEVGKRAGFLAQHIADVLANVRRAREDAA